MNSPKQTQQREAPPAKKLTVEDLAQVTGGMENHGKIEIVQNGQSYKFAW